MDINEMLFNRACDIYWIPMTTKTVIEKKGNKSRAYTYNVAGLYVDNCGYMPKDEYSLLIDLVDGRRIIFDGYHDCFVDPDDYVRFDRNRELPILSANLRRMMDERGISEEDLGYELNYVKSTVSALLDGKRLPSYKNLLDMCRIFDCTIPDLTNPY